MEVTPEMRKAVYEEDCVRFGHILSFDNSIQFQAEVASVAGPDGKQPYIECHRCHKVWLVVEQPEDDYEKATVALDSRLLPEHRPVREQLVRGTTGGSRV